VWVELRLGPLGALEYLAIDSGTGRHQCHSAAISAYESVMIWHPAAA
jgi:hypothetical protein